MTATHGWAMRGTHPDNEDDTPLGLSTLPSRPMLDTNLLSTDAMLCYAMDGWNVCWWRCLGIVAIIIQCAAWSPLLVWILSRASHPHNHTPIRSTQSYIVREDLGHLSVTLKPTHGGLSHDHTGFAMAPHHQSRLLRVRSFSSPLSQPGRCLRRFTPRARRSSLMTPAPGNARGWTN